MPVQTVYNGQGGTVANEKEVLHMLLTNAYVLLGNFVFQKCDVLLANGKIAQIMPCGFLQDEDTPVSYTHLIVSTMLFQSLVPKHRAVLSRNQFTGSAQFRTVDRVASCAADGIPGNKQTSVFSSHNLYL